MRVSEIILSLNDADQLLIGTDSLFYGKRMLTSDAEEVIIEEASVASSNDLIHLKIHFRKNEVIRRDEILTAIHKHFMYRRKKSATQLKRTDDRLAVFGGDPLRPFKFPDRKPGKKKSRDLVFQDIIHFIHFFPGRKKFLQF